MLQRNLIRGSYWVRKGCVKVGDKYPDIHIVWSPCQGGYQFTQQKNIEILASDASAFSHSFSPLLRHNERSQPKSGLSLPYFWLFWCHLRPREPSVPQGTLLSKVMQNLQAKM